jgi:acyl-CoA synthetase (AMP-forming)/AMP-acid ligase II
MKNIASLFLNAAERYPEHIAIVHNDQSVTYRDLSDDVKKTAAYFLKKGIKKGDRVLIFVPMSTDLYRVVLALFYIGATAVFLDEWVTMARMKLCCKIADCKGFIGIFKARVFAFFTSELRKIPIKMGPSFSGTEHAEMALMDEDDAALITFTTGSTGTPKAARRTHGFLKQQFDALLEEINPQPTDVDMPVLPIVLFVNLGVGCTSVIAEFKASKPDKLDAGKVFLQLNKYKVNRIIASPFFVKKLAEYVLRAGQDPLHIPSLNAVFTGGAPVFPQEAALYKQAFTQAKATIVYGSTECEPISSITANELAEQENELLESGLKVGAIFHKTTLKVIEMRDDAISCASGQELDEIEMPKGEIGEIIVSGNHVLKSYFNNEEAFRQNKIVIGDTIWHRTGDSGYLAADNSLYLTGRCGQTIRRNGEMISPFIVENFLQSIPRVSMGTVLLVKDELVVIVENEGGSTSAEIERQIKESGLSYDRIRHVSNVPRDPRHNSKIDYAKLKEIL